jgi:beta-phosphoglucomutase
MLWIENFQLFLFDFDGLLVNSEKLHYQAYQQMCRRHGCELPWDFGSYIQVAHMGDDFAIRKEIYHLFPKLAEEFPEWAPLYAEKKQIYIELLTAGKMELMPGVGSLLERLEEKGIKRCVVTHSFRASVEEIRRQLPALNSIPNWVTREDVTRPKPDPEGYQKAIDLLAEPGDRIVGFEDTLKGLRALQGTVAKPVLICASSHPQLAQLPAGALHFESFERIVNLD